jgi:RNA polymerase sigma-70 factor, ECF subfamily
MDDGVLARLISAAAPDRDTAAESEFCRRYAPRIRLFGLRHLRSDSAAADLAQDVLLVVLQELRAGGVQADRLASLVFGSCRQMLVDGRRTAARRERPPETLAAELPPVMDESPGVQHEARVQECLARLPDRERTVLVMSFFDELAAEAVGRELGIATANVRVIRHRGLERLRNCLNVDFTS